MSTTAVNLPYESAFDKKNKLHNIGNDIIPALCAPIVLLKANRASPALVEAPPYILGRITNAGAGGRKSNHNKCSKKAGEFCLACFLHPYPWFIK